jgi:CubicO group peptidase (beta-lactamase class C family)
MTDQPRQLGLMAGFPPPEDRVVTVAGRWQAGPLNRWAFQHVRELMPTVRVGRSPVGPSQLPAAPMDLDAVATTSIDGRRIRLPEWLEETHTDGFLVVRHGRIVTERYFHGMGPESTHLLQSVTKSIVGTVAGILIDRGLLSADELVTVYVPELAGTSFEGATVRHLLDMRAGTRFNEEYDDPEADIVQYEGVIGWAPADPAAPRGTYDYITTLPNKAPHGGPFDYRSILTDTLAWVIEKVTGSRLATLVSREIWQPIGAEHDADFTVDRCGTALADGGLCVTLRDLARFGLPFLTDGVYNGRRCVPQSWIYDCRVHDDDLRAAYAASEFAKSRPGWVYRDCWWVRDSDEGILMGVGIYGQMLFIDPTANVVIAKLSSWPEASPDELKSAHVRGAEAVADFLRART